MTKVAKLVTISLMTRVIVEESATGEEILIAAVPMLAEKALYEANENIESIVDDNECPFGTFDGEDKITYEVIGYKSADDFNIRNGELLRCDFDSYKEAEEKVEPLFCNYCVVKIQSSDREER